MIQSGNKGPTSVEIGSRCASSITGDKSTAAAGRWRRRERAIFTPRMMEQLWETTPEPWWLITADTGWWVGGGDTSSPAASPSAAAAAAAASTAGPLPASSSSASWQKPPRHDSSNTAATEPLDGGSTDASQKAAGIQAYRAVVLQLSCPPVCLSVSPFWLGLKLLHYIISASEATSCNS